MSDTPKQPVRQSALSAVKQVSETIQTSIKEGLIFTPSTKQRKLKSRLWVRLNENPVTDLTNVGRDYVESIVGESLKKWWSEPGFTDWLFNKMEQRERLEYLFELALDAAEEILTSDDPRSNSAKVAMVGKIAELAAKTPSKSDGEKFKDEFIQQMNRAQIEEFIKKNTARLASGDRCEQDS